MHKNTVSSSSGSGCRCDGRAESDQTVVRIELCAAHMNRSSRTSPGPKTCRSELNRTAAGWGGAAPPPQPAAGNLASATNHVTYDRDTTSPPVSSFTALRAGRGLAAGGRRPPEGGNWPTSTNCELYKVPLYNTPETNKREARVPSATTSYTRFRFFEVVCAIARQPQTLQFSVLSQNI
ncbi:hypothetical protein EVAR_15009_1 [Eumeta japonica]|uniref:Uncharacterized protein n=1 Tax=Eumeta variegata TaxID=151549 RepID=A0A4C1X5I1_EUMVA|nr:hypothetical protein EVAR_15009_1 [Eumeta japonica]